MYVNGTGSRKERGEDKQSLIEGERTRRVRLTPSLINIGDRCQGEINKALGDSGWARSVPAPPLKRMVAVPGWVVSTTRLVSKTNRHPRDNAPRETYAPPHPLRVHSVCFTLGRLYNIFVRENRPNTVFSLSLS